MNARIKPFFGKRSKTRLTHVITRAGFHRVIAGSRTYRQRIKSPPMYKGGTFGKKGTLEAVIDPKTNTMEIFHFVTERNRGNGIGTDLLEAVERIAKQNRIKRVLAKTERNPASEATCKKAGWKPLKAKGVTWWYKDIK